jgi:hypothetical protein
MESTRVQLSSSATARIAKATALTEAQIKAAIELQQQYFPEEDPAEPTLRILNAIATNYLAAVVTTKK